MSPLLGLAIGVTIGLGIWIAWDTYRRASRCPYCDRHIWPWQKYVMGGIHRECWEKGRMG